MSKKKRQYPSTEQKVAILREYLVDHATVTAALDALHDDGEGVTRSALAERLRVSGAQAGKAVAPVLESGTWVAVEKRPIMHGLGE